MNFESKKRIYRKLAKKGFKPKHVAEVGVYHPETSNLYDYIVDGVRTTLVEPDPRSISLIKEFSVDRDNITLHEVAVYKQSGVIKLAQREASTFVSELEASPAIVNDEYSVDSHDVFEVQARTFDEIDDGTIDLLSVDIEGSEWFVIQNLVSRPDVISLETHGAMYTNPKMTDINSWLKNNNYVAWYKDRSDTVFVKSGSIELTQVDKFRLFLYEIYLFVRKYRKLIKKKIKSLFQK